MSTALPLPATAKRERLAPLPGSADALALPRHPPARGDSLVRAGTVRASVSRLGNAALRPLLPPSRSGFGTAGDAAPVFRQRLRCGDRAGYHRTVPAAAAGSSSG